MNGARGQMGSGGTQTAAITAGGTPMPGSGALSESYDGSSWTETSDLNTGRQGPGGFGHTNTSAVVFGGESPPLVAKTEAWNGSSWTEVGDLGATVYIPAGVGTSTLGLSCGGNPPRTTVEEWTVPLSNLTITVS